MNSINLSNFSFDNEVDDVFVLQNGFYRFNGKCKQRGFGKSNGKEIEHLDTFERDRIERREYLRHQITVQRSVTMQN